MSNVHITLVGGQPMPILYGIRFAKPEKVIFIYSSQSRAIVERIKQFIDCQVIEQPPLDDYNPRTIYNRAISLYEQFKDDSITLNISGGLKSWSHIFGVYFGNTSNTTVFYIDQNNTVMDFRKMESIPLENVSLSIIDHLRLYGNNLNSYTDYSEYSEEDISAIATIRQARNYNRKAFNNLTINLSKEQETLTRQKEGSIKNENGLINWYYDDISDDTVIDIELYKPSRPASVTFSISSLHAKHLVFFAGWFEVYVANILHKWDKAREVLTNCRFTYDNGQDKNEIDVIVNSGNKLLFVECKTQIKNNTDLDKFISVVKTMSGTASKALFITEGTMKPETVAKCNENGILHFSFANGRSVNELYRLLDEDHNKSNK